MVCAGLNYESWLGEIQQCHIGLFLHSFEDDFTAIRGNIESVDIEVGGKIRQLPLGTGLQVDEPEILVPDFASQNYQCPSSVQEGQVSSSPSQGHVRKRMRRSLGGDCFHGKRSADVRSRIDNETAVWRPHGIDRVLADEKNGPTTIESHPEKMWNPV